MTLTYAWRAPFTSAELCDLHAACFGGGFRDWWEQVNAHSLGWVCARARSGALAGFVNVAWDGGEHAFVLDTMVDPAYRREGAGTRLVTLAAERARSTGCRWLHVDFEPHLSTFYLERCGFAPTPAGVVAL
ncbi:GNAT family N-acetyltransferase [Dactylosporangium sp. CA-233914]|uniref:GNAT family N-acetyltransferase n=1 Tax=Dactylosporangium sp. CA-233914 TaxID=3239934 RepID=UPI003D905847